MKRITILAGALALLLPLAACDAAYDGAPGALEQSGAAVSAVQADAGPATSDFDEGCYDLGDGSFICISDEPPLRDPCITCRLEGNCPPYDYARHCNWEP